jgi:hypothetical protein
MVCRSGHDAYRDNNPHHVVIRLDGVANTFFVDGAELTPSFGFGGVGTNAGFLPITGRGNIKIGRSDANPGREASGNIWDLRLYNRGLTAAEVLTICNNRGSDGITNGLYARYLMNENTDGATMTSATDYVGGYDGTPTNSPTYAAEAVRIG